MSNVAAPCLQIVRTVDEMRRLCGEFKQRGRTIGFVPTMGALHAGHLSLVRRSRSECDVTVASIFVNPMQFGPGEDFSRYPRSFEEDCRMLEHEGVTAVFAPAAEEIYPEGGPATTIVDPGPLGTRLDGASRPGHFIGVATVVAKLFNIVAPTRAYFGQKDAAQLAVLRRMVRNLNIKTALVACPIIRDHDGLAISSRNRYLTPVTRKQAAALYLTLRRVAAMVAVGEINPAPLIEVARSTFYAAKTSFEAANTSFEAAQSILAAQSPGCADEPDARIDYIALVDAETLLPVEQAEPGALFAIAAWIGNTRLIDNWIVGEAL